MSVEFENAQMPPQDLDAERGVLGSILLMNEALDEVTALLSPEHFYSNPHRVMYAAILRMHDKGVRGIDPVTLADELIRTRDLEEAGGIQYLMQVLESVPHAAHVRYYAGIVLGHANRRELIYLSREAVRKAYDQTINVAETMGAVIANIEVIFGRTSGDAREFKDVAANLKKRQLSPQTIQSTGFADLDKALNGGFKAGQLIIVAARPAMGKTAFGMSLCEAAATLNMAAMIMPLEMDGEELAERIQRQGPERLTELSGKLIYVEDRLFDLDAVCSSIRMSHRRRLVRFVIIDYLSLIEVETRENSAEKLARITRRLKRLAKELKIPIVVLAQLNRDLEKRENKRPQLSDLRGSGAIEQDADIVMFLYRHDVYYLEEKPGQCEVIIAKHRNGPTGTVEVGYLKEKTKFVPRSELPIDIDITGMFEKRKPF